MALSTRTTNKTTLLLLAVAALALSPAAWAQTAQLSGVKTSVDLDPTFVGGLIGLEIAPAPIFPGTLVGTTASFPIPGGVVDTSDLRGDIFHTGGLSLTQDATRVELLNFLIDTTGPTQLTGVVVLDGSLVDRLALFDLDLSEAMVNPGPYNTLEISNVAVTLTEGAAEALNAIFGTDALFGGFPVGVATVVAQTFGGDDGDDEGDDEADDEGDDEYGDEYGSIGSTRKLLGNGSGGSKLGTFAGR